MRSARRRRRGPKPFRARGGPLTPREKEMRLEALKRSKEPVNVR